jgi:hypothetical protein
MPGFMPGIHVFPFGQARSPHERSDMRDRPPDVASLIRATGARKTWMAGINLAMTLIVITGPIQGTQFNKQKMDSRNRFAKPNQFDA